MAKHQKDDKAKQGKKKKLKNEASRAVKSDAKAEAPTPAPVKTKIINNNNDYLKELARLQVELVKLQEWVKVKGLKVVVIFEGRDAAGKGGGDQADHRKPQSPRCPRGGPGHPDRAREDAVVLSALRGASPRGG